MKIVTPKTKDNLGVTITARVGSSYIRWMTSTKHHPKGGVIYIEEK